MFHRMFELLYWRRNLQYKDGGDCDIYIDQSCRAVFWAILGIESVISYVNIMLVIMIGRLS
jgi:hypothetical protein